MKKLFLAFCLLFTSQSVWAHGAHHANPHHQHRQVQGTEVTLQLHSRKAYDMLLRQKGLKASLAASPQVLQVILARSGQWLNTRVKLKVTDAQGKSVGAAAGQDPVLVKEKNGPHYALAVNLNAKQKYFVMVQFAGNNGLQRAGFELVI